MSHTDYKIVTVITLMKEQILYSTCKGENRTVNDNFKLYTLTAALNAITFAEKIVFVAM